LNKWPKRGERMTQNFGELIFYTSQSQWPRGLKRGICGRSLAGILSSHRLGAWIFVFCENYALRYRYLPWADHSSRGILQTVVCPLSVITKPRHGEPLPGITSRHHGGRGAGGSCTKATWNQKQGNRNWLIWGLRT
jgi:hypothetical protein